MTKRMLVALAVTNLLFSACIGDECDDALDPDIKRGSVCADTPARCAQLRLNADRELRFVANIGTAGGGGSRFERASCVARFMRERGANEVTVSAEGTTVSAVGTLRRVGPGLEFKTVTNYTVACTAAGCANCAGPAVTAEACQADAFCVPLTASPLDAQRQCLAAATYVGCQASGVACDDALTWAASPTGVCHLFNSGCLPAGWAASVACGSGGAAPAACM